MEHECKCWPEPFQEVLNGTRTHLTLDNEDDAVPVCAPGDTLKLREWDPTYDNTDPHWACPMGFTGREVQVKVLIALQGGNVVFV